MTAGNTSLRRSLVLAGGGMRLAYHAGVLIALEEAGISYKHADGTSGGIFGVAMLASGLSPAEIAGRWRKLKLSDFAAALPFVKYLRPRSLPALASARGIRDKVFPALGIDITKINANIDLEATFNLCNFSRKTLEAIGHQEVTADHLVAGVSLPVFMPAIQIDSDWYTDAVWIRDANMLEALNRGAEEIWLVWCIGNTPGYADGAFLQYVHMIEMSANGGLFAELELIRRHNAERLAQGLKPVNIHIIKPEFVLPLDPDFFFHKIDADTLINMGYADTKNYLAAREVFSFEDIPGSTAMKAAGTYIHFRQQFSGRASIAGRHGALDIYLAFYIRECEGAAADQLMLQQYSSVRFNRDWQVSGYDNKLKISKKGKATGSFNFIVQGVVYVLCYESEIPCANDLLLGLAFKTALVTVRPLSDTVIEPGFLLYQAASNRIRNAFYLHVHSKTGWWKKQQSKYRLLNEILK
ncbi:Patatin-like phospholipase [Pedobacter westerhofensis]|uniref:Patatin-like phospholipase n=1 Tax=Pedobacter westerhofensis TaxID=425512 RepID=A0A521CTU5_9SPHI|nr:patatin-like phospholipase family protein [Pedobacter westerhofensis]SMO62838.1 Patatin-like phospholipase [Pedobacter westerhofensis]